MSLSAELLPFAVLGALGSAHCAAMCGGFACAALARPAPTRLAHLARAGAYVLGKACAYAVLGLLAAAAVRAAATGPWPAPDAARRVLAFLAGASLLVAGLAALGVRLAVLAPRRWAARIPVRAPLARAAGRLYGAARALPGRSGALAALAIGLVSGCLPCGLSWSALLLATQASPAAALLGPLVFGLATAPALLATAFAGRALLARAGRHAPRVLGLTLIGLGLLCAWRGGPPGAARAAGAAPCCAPAYPAP
jgi:sulfite exporter TauE/SafE